MELEQFLGIKDSSTFAWLPRLQRPEYFSPYADIWSWKTILNG